MSEFGVAFAAWQLVGAGTGPSSIDGWWALVGLLASVAEPASAALSALAEAGCCPLEELSIAAEPDTAADDKTGVWTGAAAATAVAEAAAASRNCCSARRARSLLVGLPLTTAHITRPGSQLNMKPIERSYVLASQARKYRPMKMKRPMINHITDRKTGTKLLLRVARK